MADLLLAAGLAGLPYLGASFLAQSGFKETVMAMLVVACQLFIAVNATQPRVAPAPRNASLARASLSNAIRQSRDVAPGRGRGDARVVRRRLRSAR